MGTLKPGASYIYEREGATVYAREFGSTERKVIGVDMPKRRDPRQMDIIETQLWQDIVAAGKSNPALQKVLDRAILIYQTIKDNDE
jgi:hypothetical protein